MSFLDDFGSWASGLFDSGSADSLGGSLGDAANSYYDSGGDAVAGSVGSGSSGLGGALGDLAGGLGTSPSVDSLLARLGTDNGSGMANSVGPAVNGAGGTAPSIDSLMHESRFDASAPVQGTQNVTAALGRSGGAQAAQANNSDSWLQKLMKGDSGANRQALMAMQGIGLLGSLIHHSQPSAGQLRDSLKSPYSSWTPQQQQWASAYFNAGPRTFVPWSNGHKRGGSVGALDCLKYAGGGAIPGAMSGPMTAAPMAGGPQTMGMNPGASSGAMMGPQSMPMQGGPQAVPPMGGGNPMLQQFASTHPNFNLNNPHPNFAQNHPNWMANNYPSAGVGGGGGINPGAGATPDGRFPQQGLGGGGLGVLGPARAMMGGAPQTGGGINPGATGGAQAGFNGGINPGAGMAGPGGGSGPLIGNGPAPMPGGMAAFADGGMVDPAQGGDPFTGFVQGDDPGQSDLVPIRVSPGEYVFDADSVAALGDGNNAAGAALLDRLRETLRQGKRSAPANDIPPPLALLAQQGGGSARGQ